MAYSEVSDLLLGPVLVSQSVDKQKFINQAAEDMDAKLGWIYDLPLSPQRAEGAPYTDPQPDADPENDWKALPLHERLLLKGINNKLASGRLLLTLDIAGEGTTLHAYGWQLVREANAELLIISNGEVFLHAQGTEGSADQVDESRTPSVQNHDEESLMLGFENNVMRRSNPTTVWLTQPGESVTPWP